MIAEPCAASEVVAWPDRSTAGHYAPVPDQHGSVRWCASSQSEAAGVWSRRPIDAREVCAPVLKGTEERLPRCRGDRRGRPAPFLLEGGVAVRQGLRFLRAELPRILANPPKMLSARMLRVIEDLA